MLETQPKWYVPAWEVLGWHIGFWNLTGKISASRQIFISALIADRKTGAFGFTVNFYTSGKYSAK